MTSVLPNDVGSAAEADVSLFATFSRQPLVELNLSALTGDYSLPAFYCVHSISGNAGKHYKLLAKKLNHVVRFYGIQAPQYKVRTPTFGGSVEEIVDYYTDALLEAQPTGSFLLGGYSVGSLIALEIAQRLRDTHKRDVDLLVSIDGTFETMHADYCPKHLAYAWGVLRNLPAWTMEALFDHKTSVYVRFKHAAWKMLGFEQKSAAEKYEMTGEICHPVRQYDVFHKSPGFLRDFMMRLYDALIAHEHHDYHGDVVVYEAALTRLFRLSSVGRAWRAVARQATIVRISGSHATILYEPHVSKLADDLISRLTPLK